MHLNLNDGCLAVFVDDTGHEKLAPGHSVYGLGGCATMALDLDALIREPWRTIRNKILGSPDLPLHAAEFAQHANKENIELVANFFRDNPFFRFGAIINITSELDESVTPIQAIAMVLKQRIIEIANRTPFKEIKVIFESSERANKLIEAAFGDFQIQENGKLLPVECYFMPKSANDPALESADFVMHAIGRQARFRIKGEPGLVPDFKAVFHSVDKRLTSFIDITSVKINTVGPSP